MLPDGDRFEHRLQPFVGLLVNGIVTDVSDKVVVRRSFSSDLSDIKVKTKLITRENTGKFSDKGDTNRRYSKSSKTNEKCNRDEIVEECYKRTRRRKYSEKNKKLNNWMRLQQKATDIIDSADKTILPLEKHNRVAVKKSRPRETSLLPKVATCCITLCYLSMLVWANPMPPRLRSEQVARYINFTKVMGKEPLPSTFLTTVRFSFLILLHIFQIVCSN